MPDQLSVGPGFRLQSAYQGALIAALGEWVDITSGARLISSSK